MPQFIQYLYEYRDGKKVRNLGFMKVEKQMDKSIIRIYAKPLDEVKGIWFQREDGSRYMAAWEETMGEKEGQSPQIRQCKKIQRQDLAKLPRKEWRLANNHFLLHGFYNYHHLLCIEEEDFTWIGVPGVYHENERAAAEAFGFTEFRRPEDLNISSSEEGDVDFGYWCRKVKQ